MGLRGAVTVHPVQQLRDEFDRLFTGVMANPAVANATRLVSGRGFPAVNVWENTDHVFVEAEVPGVKADDLDISVVGDELTLKGDRREEPQSGVSVHRRERGVGSFTRLIRLPSEIDSERVQASLTDGVLLLTLSKAEASKPRKVQVKTQGN